MEIGKLRTVEGDVTEPQITAPNEVAIIPHVCNNGTDSRGIGVMGAGVALALKNKWEKVYKVYKDMESKSPNGLKNRLGEICWAKVEYIPNTDKPTIVVVNMIAQDGIVSNTNSIPLKYWALMKCMENTRILIARAFVKYEVLPEHLSRKPVIHTCKFGSGLACGNWDFILELIREQWLEYGIDVVIYEFKK